MTKSPSDVFLCSGYMLNCIFGTKHNDPDSLWVLTKEGFVEYDLYKKLQTPEK